MKPADRIIHPRWLITDSRARRLLEHHSLVIASGRVIDVCPSTVARQFYRAPWVHELPHHLVVPGLLNLHTQAATVLFRGLADDSSYDDWHHRVLQPVERACLSEEMVRTGTELAIAEMLRGGQTLFADHYPFPHVVGEAALAAGIRVKLNLPVLAGESAWSRSAEDALRRCLAIVDRFKGNRQVSTGFGPQAPNTLSDTVLGKVATLAAELGLSIAMPLQETARERSESLQRFGITPINRLDRLGLLSADFQAIHAIHLTDAEYALFAERGVQVIHCPITNAKLACGTAQVARLQSLGLTVGLGTGSPAANNGLSLLEEAKFASLMGRVVARDASALPAWTCLEMMTAAPATMLGRPDLGHLNPGAEADIAAFPFETVNTAPMYHPLSQLLFANHGLSASDVWVGGEMVLRHGRLVHIDEEAAIEVANAFATRMTA